MKHLSRAAFLLIAIIIVAFLLPRVMPSVASVDEFGFYPESSVEDAAQWSALPMKYADPSECKDCHTKEYKTWSGAAHRTSSCENCHGPGKAHMETRELLVVNTSRELCGQCHSKITARPKNFPQVDFAVHGGQSACVDCHNPHNPRAASGLVPPVPHTIEGRSNCLSCHQIGGLKPFPQDHRDRGQDTCLNCHKTK